MKKDQVDRAIKAGKLLKEDYQIDKFGAIIIIVWFFLFTALTIVIVSWDVLHDKKPITGMVVAGTLTGIAFAAQLRAFLQEDKLTSASKTLNCRV